MDGNVVPVERLRRCCSAAETTDSARELFGDEWQQLIWACRRKGEKTLEYLYYHERFDWLTSAICPFGNKQVERMSSLNERTSSLNEIPMWKLDNNETTSQYYAGNSRIIRMLDEHCVGKIWRTAVQVV